MNRIDFEQILEQIGIKHQVIPLGNSQNNQSATSPAKKSNNNNNPTNHTTNRTNNNQSRIYQLYVVKQIDNDSCGYHALKNAHLLLDLLQQSLDREGLADPTPQQVAASLKSDDYHWKWFFESRQILVDHCPPQNTPEDLWRPERVLQSCIEDEYAEYLISSPVLEKYHDQIIMLPELSYLGKSPLQISKLLEIEAKIQKFYSTPQSALALIVSGVPYHWTCLVAQKSQDDIFFVYIDSFESKMSSAPFRLADILRQKKSFIAYYLEEMLVALVQDIFGDSLIFLDSDCPYGSQDIKMTCGDKSLRIRKTAQHIRDLKATPSPRFTSILSAWVQFLTKGYKKYDEQLPVFTYWKLVSEALLKSLRSTLPFKELLNTTFDTLENETDVSLLEPADQILLCVYDTRLAGLMKYAVAKAPMGDLLIHEQNLKAAMPLDEQIAPSIQKVSAYSNQIPDISPFLVLSNLRDLNLSSNQITKIPIELFTKCPKIAVLSLASNYIASVPAEISKLVHLEILNLSANSISVLPLSLGDLPNLHTLLLIRNQLLVFPQVIFACHTLQALDVSRNNFSTIPAQITQHPSLKVLFATGARLESDVSKTFILTRF